MAISVFNNSKSLIVKKAYKGPKLLQPLLQNLPPQAI